MELSPFITSGLPYLVAFGAGLFSAVHCAAMCGPVVAALHVAGPRTHGAAGSMSRQLAFNAGRVLSYTAAGAALGLLGVFAADALTEWRGWLVLRTVAALLMVGAGLYIAGWWRGLVWLEHLGARLTRALQGRLPRPRAPRRARDALALGLAWGGIPCGLVYTALVWSLAAGDALAGALFMFCFGLGTLPAVLGAGWGASRLLPLLARAPVRHATGAFVALAGLWVLAFTAAMQPNFGIGCAPAL